MSFANNVKVRVTSSVGLDATDIIVDKGQGAFNTPPSDGAVLCIVDHYNNPTQLEVITYAGLVDNLDGTVTLTGVTRGAEGSTRYMWQPGATVYQAVTAGRANEWDRIQELCDQHEAEKATDTEARAHAAGKFPDAAQVLKQLQVFGLGASSSTEVNDCDLVSATGLYRINVVGEGNRPPGINFGSLIAISRSLEEQTQLAISTNSYQMQVRYKVAGAWSDWSTVWNAGNGGAGSGLDADTLDGLHHGNFIRSDVGDSAQGVHSFYGVGTSGSYNDAPIRLQEVSLVGSAQSGNEYAPSLSFLWSGFHGGKLLLTAGGTLAWALDNGAAKTLWHSGNDGAGSGLDADYLDGIEGDFYRGRNHGDINIDPNLADMPNILTNHANSPGGGVYWHITTTFFPGVTSSANRSQIASQYNGSDHKVYGRHCYSGTWSAWVRLDGAGSFQVSASESAATTESAADPNKLFIVYET